MSTSTQPQTFTEFSLPDPLPWEGNICPRFRFNPARTVVLFGDTVHEKSRHFRVLRGLEIFKDERWQQYPAIIHITGLVIPELSDETGKCTLIFCLNGEGETQVVSSPDGHLDQTIFLDGVGKDVLCKLRPF